MSKIDVTKLDLYGLLEVSPNATQQEIKAAYRKRALKVHPDKNRDNPEAKQLFQQLSEAFKVLSDDSAKAAYDRVLKARKETELRNRLLDSKRRKLKEDLEARERAYQATGKVKTDTRTPEEQLKAEIERLRRQGSAQLAEEQERIRKELAKEREYPSCDRTLTGKLKVSWKTDSECPNPYTYEKLNAILQKYGNINALIISSKKPGSAIVEYAKKKDADLAYSVEKGLYSCPLTLSLIKGDQPTYSDSPTPPPTQAPAQAMSMADFEAKVLQSMREAQERKRRMAAASES